MSAAPDAPDESPDPASDPGTSPDPAPAGPVDRRDLKAVQAAYHDWEASTYDAKFGISWDDHVTDYAVGRYRRGLGDTQARGRILELGAGTGFFSVNLVRGGMVDGELHVTDISPGMLEVCRRNGQANGVEVHTRVGDAEALPYDDTTFDVVLGHAFLHHLPVPGLAVREAFRVLKPGGRLLVAGEPSYWGERANGVVKRLTWRAFTAVAGLPGIDLARDDGEEPGDGDHDGEDTALAGLEHDVDLHTFHPDELERMAAVAGFTDVRVATEELAANWWGWSMRTIEGSMRPDLAGPRWATMAFGGYRALTRLDEAVLRHVLPRGLFYNLVLSARRPLAEATG